MQIWVGIDNNQLSSLDHPAVVLSSSATMSFVPNAGVLDPALQNLQSTQLSFKTQAQGLSIDLGGRVLNVLQASLPLYIKSTQAIAVTSLHRAGGGAHPTYPGDVRIDKKGPNLRLSIRLSLDQYLRGVLSSEMPASYHAEALKCQAVAARTYALNPRVSHVKDGVNVCDSYMCCQYFAGSGGSVDPRIEKAIDATGSSSSSSSSSSGAQILTFNEKPILALFSSNAGGHTEDYQNCFSDLETGAFPPPAIPYLKGVAEGTYPGFKGRVGSEEFLRFLHKAKSLNQTDVCTDLFSNKFAWSKVLSADSLEAHVHHAVMQLLEDKESGPFVTAPPAQKFGHIKGFEVIERGVSGVAIALKIKTSAGDWLVRKELVIRKVFANPEAKIARLNSARIFFDQSFDALGLLSGLTVGGLGFGHGVGLQQTGAQGFAMAGSNYKQILAHYFPGTELTGV